MGTIAKVKAGGATHLIASTAYGTCDTAKNVVAKVATIQDSQAFTLMTGVTVHIKFTYHNTASDPTLNVNSTGAKAIKCYGTTKTGTSETGSWYAGSVVSFTYDGKYWIQNDYKYNTDTTYSSKAAASGGTNVSLCTTGEKYTWNNKSNLALGTTATTALKGNASAQDIKYISGVTDTIYDVINETQQVVNNIDVKISALYRMSTKISINANSSKTIRVGQDGNARVGFIVFGQGANGNCSPIFYLIGGYVTASRCGVINISGKTGITINSSSTSNLNFVFTNTASFNLDLYFFPLYDNTFTPI